MDRPTIPGLAFAAVLTALVAAACTSPVGPDAVLSQDVKIDVQNQRDWILDVYAERNLLPFWEANVPADHDTIYDLPVEVAEAGPMRFVFFSRGPENIPPVWSDTLELAAGDVVEIVAAPTAEESTITVRSP